MSDMFQFIFEQPWYVLVLVFGSVVYFLYTNFKDVVGGSSDGEVSFRYATKTSLSNEQQFAVALDAVMTAYWEVDNNILAFTHQSKKPKQFEQYMRGWFIDTKERYTELTEYFLQDGRRSYFEFLYPLYKDEPKKQWSDKVQAEYGDAARPRDMLARLSEYDVVGALVRAGVIESEADMKIGVAGWDISTLVGQARRAYTAGLIGEAEALKTIDTAMQMARQHFTSWQDFGRSQVIGMALDYYKKDDTFFEEYIETYREVSTSPDSPWQKISWG